MRKIITSTYSSKPLFLVSFVKIPFDKTYEVAVFPIDNDEQIIWYEVERQNFSNVFIAYKHFRKLCKQYINYTDFHYRE